MNCVDYYYQVKSDEARELTIGLSQEAVVGDLNKKVSSGIMRMKFVWSKFKKEWEEKT